MVPDSLFMAILDQDPIKSSEYALRQIILDKSLERLQVRGSVTVHNKKLKRKIFLAR